MTGTRCEAAVKKSNSLAAKLGRVHSDFFSEIENFVPGRDLRLREQVIIVHGTDEATESLRAFCVDKVWSRHK